MASLVATKTKKKTKKIRVKSKKKISSRRHTMPTQRLSRWADIKQSKIPAGQEAGQEASSRALRDALDLKGLRTGHGVTQAELAARLGKSQGNVSELERRDDVYLSSLREYVEALGGTLEIAAVFEDERTSIAIG